VGLEQAPDADFDYLLGLSFHDLSPEKADRLEADLRRTEELLAALEQTPEDSMWIDDLKEFREAYEKEYGLQQRSGKGRRKASDSSFPAATSTDWKEAQKLFDRGRRGRAGASSTTQIVQGKKMTRSPAQLKKMNKRELQLVARESGLEVGMHLSMAKMIERLLSKADLTHTGKFTVEDLRAHLEARGQPTMGLKRELQARLQKWVKAQRKAD
jgi:hypothetical protein